MFLLHLITSKYDKTNSRIDTETLYTDSPTKPFLYNQYTYDADNQIKEIKDELGKTITAYTYDYTDQLLTEVLPNGTSIEYSYDNLGNRVSKKITKSGATTSTNYKFNGANQIISDGKNTFTYDKNGNLSNDGRYQYTWNAFDQLTTVKTTAGVAVASYKYDENSRRVYSKVGTNETYYRYDGSSNHVLFEEDANGKITKAYTYDDDGHPLTMTYNGLTYYYLTNYRGDVLALTDVNGKVVAKYTYDAWGNILASEGTMASINSYRYAGYRYDEETKLYYLMARYYNPDTGVFLSIDPVRGDTKNPVSLNGYNYANNNPVMNVDPDGEYSFSAALKKALRAFIKIIFKDFRENTLTNLVLILSGGIASGWIARKVAKSGLVFGDRKVTKKTVIGFITGGFTAYVFGAHLTKVGGLISRWGSKLWAYEKWFDKLWIGKTIDKTLSKIEAFLLKLLK